MKKQGRKVLGTVKIQISYVVDVNDRKMIEEAIDELYAEVRKAVWNREEFEEIVSVCSDCRLREKHVAFRRVGV